MQKLEIERKFLLKSIPNKKPDDVIDVKQYYWKNKDNIWERARTYHSDIIGDRYVHTIKKSVSKGVSLEDEKDITKEEFDQFVNICSKDSENSLYIKKKRYIFNEKKLKWEVDVFKNGYKMIIAEIELPRKRYHLVIPDYISEVKLLEVTYLKQFSSRALAMSLTDKDKFKRNGR